MHKDELAANDAEENRGKRLKAYDIQPLFYVYASF